MAWDVRPPALAPMRRHARQCVGGAPSDPPSMRGVGAQGPSTACGQAGISSTPSDARRKGAHTRAQHDVAPRRQALARHARTTNSKCARFWAVGLGQHDIARGRCVRCPELGARSGPIAEGAGETDMPIARAHTSKAAAPKKRCHGACPVLRPGRLACATEAGSHPTTNAHAPCIGGSSRPNVTNALSWTGRRHRRPPPCKLGKSASEFCTPPPPRLRLVPLRGLPTMGQCIACWTPDDLRLTHLPGCKSQPFLREGAATNKRWCEGEHPEERSVTPARCHKRHKHPDASRNHNHDVAFSDTGLEPLHAKTHSPTPATSGTALPCGCGQVTLAPF